MQAKCHFDSISISTWYPYLMTDIICHVHSFCMHARAIDSNGAITSDTFPHRFYCLRNFLCNFFFFTFFAILVGRSSKEIAILKRTRTRFKLNCNLKKRMKKASSKKWQHSIDPEWKKRKKKGNSQKKKKKEKQVNFTSIEIQQLWVGRSFVSCYLCLQNKWLLQFYRLDI